MQNRYVGDVADFAKHGLLRFLSGATDTERPEPKLRLGLVWYLYHDERHGPDPISSTTMASTPATSCEHQRITGGNTAIAIPACGRAFGIWCFAMLDASIAFKGRASYRMTPSIMVPNSISCPR